MQKFRATIQLIGINPYVSIPENILQQIFIDAGKEKSPIPIKGTINGDAFTQTLVRYSGEWRLYINFKMLKHSPKRIGEVVDVSVAFDPEERTVAQHPKLTSALAKNKQAKVVFDSLPPSRRHEIVRYIAALKTEESIERNIIKAIDFLNGKGRFVGRDKP